jgi:iron complex outermembrane receptor protein
VPVVLGSRVFEPEEVLSYEAGYRWAGLPDWVVDLTGFYNDYSDLRSLEPTAGGPLVLDNLLEGETEGATLAANWRARTGVRLRGGVTWLDTDLRLQPGGRDLNAATGEANDPRWHGFLRADLDLPRQLELGLWLRGVDNLPAPAVPAYTELDVRLGWRTRPDLVVSLVGQNLLHDSHPEFGPAAGRGEVERGFYGQVSWSF